MDDGALEASANYRSIRSLVVPLGTLTLVTGANGSGKSNLYRALSLLSEAAQGGFLDHAIFGGTTGFRCQKQVVQAMSSLRLFKCWLVMIDRALLQPTVRAAA